MFLNSEQGGEVKSIHWFRPFLTSLAALTVLAGCTTTPVETGPPEIPEYPADKVLIDGVRNVGEVISDPWEGFNRTIYRFNYRLDKYVLLPAVAGYQAVTPDFMQQGIHNFFSNLRDITTLINSVLQLNPRKSAETSARIVWNTTAGLLGFIDVASGMDIPSHEEDFGQTLGYWGVSTGPYLVLPVMGPSSLRDGVGVGVDWYVSGEIWDRATSLESWQDWAITLLKIIDTRANVSFRYYELNTPFEYEYVRWLFTTKRQMDIER